MRLAKALGRMEAALSKALARLTTPEPDAEARRRLLRAKGKTLHGELARLTEAVSVGGPLKSLVSAIKRTENQVDQVEFELGRLEGQDPLTSRDRDRISKDLRTCLNDWRALLHRHIPQARQILRKLLVERVVFTPKTDHYEFVGTWTLGKLVSGVVNLPQGMASLSMPSWNRILAWLREMAALQDSGIIAA